VLAYEVTKIVHGQDEADKAVDMTQKLFSGEMTIHMPEVRIEGALPLVDLLVATNLLASNSEARRMIEQGGVKVNQQKVTDPNAMLKKGDVIKIGKRKFAKVV